MHLKAVYMYDIVHTAVADIDGILVKDVSGNCSIDSAEGIIQEVDVSIMVDCPG